MLKEFKDVIGYESVKVELERIVDIIRNPEKYEKLGVKFPAGLMLVGNPGTGKTLMSKCFIKACGCKSYIIRKDIADGDFVKEIKNTFKKAKENEPCIVFLDDMDKFSNLDMDHRNSDEFVTIQSCIDNCKGSKVFVLATANNLGNVPKSLLRAGRFDKMIRVNNPSPKDAEEISRYYLKKKKVEKDLDYKEIGRLLNGGSCAQLETILNEAGIYAGYDGRELINMDDIVKSFTRVVYGAPEMLEYKDSKYLKYTAIHEAGHTVVSEILEPESINIVTIKKHDGGNCEGFAGYTRDEDYFESKHYMENRIIVLLAGKAATEIMLGIDDVGAGSDVERAFNIARRFVEEYNCFGFSNHDIGGFEVGTSAQLLNRKEILTQGEVARLYRKAEFIIANNRGFLFKLAKELAEKKTLVFSEIQAIKKSCDIKEYGREIAC